VAGDTEMSASGQLPGSSQPVSSVAALPVASVKYVFAVFVGLVLLGACAVPLRR
jgi:hypothetical protein